MDRKEGRSFDDSDDEEYQEERKRMKTLQERFQDIDFVLENAALTAAFFHNLFYKSEEYFSLLFVYVIRKYLKVNETKNSMRNYNHINMEIYTTFIHPSSILTVQLDDEELMGKIMENIDSEDCIIYFNKISQLVVRDVLAKSLQRFVETIELGLESYSYTNKIYEDMNREKELKILESLHTTIHSSLMRNQKVRCLPLANSDIKSLDLMYEFQVRAIVLAMNTQYEYFVNSKKYSYILKHPESLLRMKTFLSTSPGKPSTKQRIKGHCFEEHSKPEVTMCIVCDLILWGQHPCCLFCLNCKYSIHRDCKENVKACQTEMKVNRKAEPVETEVKEINRNTEPNKNTASEITDTGQGQKDCNNESDQSYINKLHEKEKPSRKISLSKVQEWKSSFVNEKSKKRSVKHTKSLHVNPAKVTPDNDITRSLSARSPEHSFPDPTNRKVRRSSSEEHRCINSVPPLPISNMDSDEEMNVTETFEPIKALECFPSVSNESSPRSQEEYRRLLVLMELHHKIRFTRMSLKRIKYVLVDPWIRMDEYMELFDCLSLCCIEKLYRLISSLVEVIDACQGQSSYDLLMADRVLNWLTSNEEANLKRWFQLSTDLCCTNILHSVKASWVEYKQLSPKLNDLFSKEINRLLAIEQLSNMRSLLFNLPMIVNKIVKDLKRIPQFKDESIIWESVYNKLTHLPQLIDERCMPLVQLINDGIIVSSTLKYKRYKDGIEYDKDMKTYIDNFPKTVFKKDFIDFQLVKISNLRESRQVNVKPKVSSVYVRDDVDAALVCYDNEIIILQRENEKYLLKLFKSPGDDKLFPMIPLNHVHARKQTGKEDKEFQYELTLLVIDQAILAQILFRTEASRDLWFDHINKKSGNVPRNLNLRRQPDSVQLHPLEIDNDCLDYEQGSEKSEVSTATPKPLKIAYIKSKFNESINNFQTVLDMVSEELQTNEREPHSLERVSETGSGNPSEFMLEYLHTLKEYALLGYQMMDQSSSIDNRVLLQKEIIIKSKPKFRCISKKIATLFQGKSEDSLSESSEEPIDDVENNDNTTNTDIDIQAFVTEIIDESLNQIE